MNTLHVNLSLTEFLVCVVRGAATRDLLEMVCGHLLTNRTYQ